MSFNYNLSSIVKTRALAQRQPIKDYRFVSLHASSHEHEHDSYSSSDLGVGSIESIDSNRSRTLNSMVAVVKATEQRGKQSPWQQSL